MTERDKAAQEGDSGAHHSALSAAVLRIGASLDLDTVLEEVVATARALTGAGCGAIATVDASGQRTRRCWCCSPPRPRPRLPMRGRTARSAARGATSSG